ncbi:uncharacterized protein [Linepithema humile]|uniref:uncharacterized protein isoform X2 n=1 Tax=Linepithema humile TaxID=83485 RepID=UPI0006239206|nr:PREDICTED: endothelial PAS domain-containing protein 1-like isoform X2 [Linepithema humile]XP_012232499.1 PREDICTED: endothelial PAS domain-containing protein 1-like isoform X2 [Linepithema humile]
MKDEVDDDDSGTSSSVTSVPESVVLYGNPRASRNMAEKQRRDNLNTHIASMAALIPIVATSTKKMDKISVLRLACAFLRTHYTIGQGLANFLPEQFNEFDLEQYFVDHLVDSNGFFLIVTSRGKIVYVSRQVEQHLGHVQNELLGQYLYSFVYPDDYLKLAENITPDGMKVELPEYLRSSSRTSESMHDNNSSSSDDSTSTQRTKDWPFFSEQRRTFQIRMAQRTVSKREHTQYEWFEISGVFRIANACKNSDLNGNKGRHRETTERSRITTNDVIFAGMATLPKKRSITELSIMDANKDEYVTRHLVDGRIIYCDHRVSVVAGYMSEEVSGLNAFAFMHKDDFRWTMIGLRQMYDRAETCGSSCYRLLTKTGQFIYLRTHGYLEFDKDTQTVESFVCVNTLVSEEEGLRLIMEMKEKFSAIVSTNGLIPNLTDINSSIELCSSSQSSNPKCSLEDPTQLEDAITHLISDLPSPSPSSMSEDSFSPMPNTQYVKAAIFASRMPPVATHANKVGINKLDLFKMKGKSNCTSSKESNNHKHTIGKCMNPNKAKESSISDSESAKSSGKSIKVLDMMETAHNSRGNSQNVDVPTQSNSLATHKPNTNPCVSCSSHTSCMDAPQSANVSNTQERMKQQSNASMLPRNTLHEFAAYNIKVECGVETFNCRQKQKSVLQYLDCDSVSDSSIVSASVETHTTSRGTLKRICSDEDFSTTHKKRPSNVYASTNTNEEQQDVSHMKCRGMTSASENKYPTLEFNQFNDVNSQPLMTASPNSNLHEVGTDYQQLIDPFGNPLIVTNADEEQFMQNLKDAKDDTPLSPDLDANPEFMMKILDGFPNESTTDFKNDFNESRAQQFIALEDQIVNEGLRRKHIDLSKEQTKRESQINVLAQDLKGSALRAQRENLSQIEAEHNKQIQMLKTLQQDHARMQANARYLTISDMG